MIDFKNQGYEYDSYNGIYYFLTTLRKIALRTETLEVMLYSIWDIVQKKENKMTTPIKEYY